MRTQRTKRFGAILLLAVTLMLCLASCGGGSRDTDGAPYGSFTVQVDRKNYTFCFENGILYYTEGAKLFTEDKAIYTLVSKKDSSRKITVDLQNSTVWKSYFPDGDPIYDDEKLEAVWEDKIYLVRFHEDDKRAANETVTYKNGATIQFRNCEAPEGKRFVGWFNKDYSVQYTKGTTPIAGYETVNGNFFTDHAGEYIIDLRPKFEPAA
ncbi:MAG: hypothetical protein E7620_00500 [Ruminococcaceae bacterium]|nr:hypothetical protein [Oscillospiraceae bacterium]